MSKLNSLKRTYLIKRIINKYEYLIISTILPLIWPAVAKYCKLVSRDKKFVPPIQNHFSSAKILVGTTPPVIPVQHAIIPLQSMKSWTENTLKISNVEVIFNLKDINTDVVIIGGEWFKSAKPHYKFFVPAFKLASKLYKQKLPVWFMLMDTYRLEVLIAASILVAKCGGAIVLQQNTKEEAIKFGIPFPSGPHIWLLNLGNVSLFQSHINWKNRKRRIIFGFSGDKKRETLFKKFQTSSNLHDWEVIPTSHQFNFDSYRKLTKQAKISIITNKRQSAIDKRLRFLRKYASDYLVGSRIFEGFCAGCLVITNTCPTLTKLGFKPNIHYIDCDLWEKENFVIPDDKTLSKIADQGRKHFFRLVEYTI
jgi:hypothetical protein